MNLLLDTHIFLWYVSADKVMTVDVAFKNYPVMLFDFR